MKMTILLTLGAVLMFDQTGLALTRLGLHVTQEELDIWRNRALSGPYKSAWDQRILPKANSFKDNPMDGTWDGWAGPGCLPDSNPPLPGRTNGDKLLASAFVYLITGDSVYRNSVRTQLLSQAAKPGTDFTNTDTWCGNMIVLRGHEYGPWLTKLLFAYDYIRSTLSSNDRSILDTWFRNAAILFERETAEGIKTSKFPNRPDYAECAGGGCPGNFKGKTHWNGWDAYGFHGGGWNNRQAVTMMFAGSVAILVNDVALQDKLKMWVKEFVMFSMFSDGTVFDQYRWNDKDPPAISSSWGHGALQLNVVLVLSDHFARAGDPELYDFTTTQGMFGSEGGPKSLLKGMQRKARMANGTITVYGSYDSTLTADEILTWEVDNGHINDFAMALSNIYYQDAEVKTAYTRTPPANPSCGGYNCWSEPWGIYPDVLFMFGQMEGQVWPYAAAPPSGPLLTFSANPLTILAGGSARLAWTSQNAAQCTGSGGWSGTKPLNGTETVSPLLTTEYTLTCTSDSGQAVQTMTVTVNPSDQEEQVIGDATFSGDSGNLTTLNREPQNLWDGDTTTEDGSTGAPNTSSFFMEFDLGQARGLTWARLFGDNQGTWVCNTWQLQHKAALQDNWTEGLSLSCADRRWYEGLLDASARYVRVTVQGASGGTQAFELEVYALKAPSGSNPPQRPKRLRIVK